MANQNSDLLTSHFPKELTQSIVQNAERDADDVVILLSALGLGPGDSASLHLPAELLLGLGAAMRLLRWETQATHVHDDANLPSARSAAAQLLLSFGSTRNPVASKQAIQFSREVFDLSISQFAWGGLSILGADILLGEPDEDALLDALAQFVWQHRHRGVVHEKATDSTP